MKVGFKRVLLGLLALLVVGIGALAVFLLTFDPNAYKGKFEEYVYERYQRTLSIEGDIELSLFPRIGLSLQNVSLSNPNASEDLFASIDSARFAVAIWPLLSERLVVDHVSISGFKAWIRRDEQGDYNFHDLFEGRAGMSDAVALLADPPLSTLATRSSGFVKEAVAQTLSESDSPEAPQEAALHVDIAGLELKEGQIHYLDLKRNKAARLVNLQLNTGRMTFDQPFEVSLRGNLQGEEPQADATVEGQALVKITPVLKTYSAQRLNLLVSGLVGPLEAQTIALRGNFAYNGYSHMLDASAVEMQVQGAVQGDRPVDNLNARLTMPRLKVDQAHSEFNIEKMSLRATGGLPEQTFDVAFDAPRLSISPEAAEGEAVAGTVKLEGKQTLGLSLGMNGLGGNAWNLSLKTLEVKGQLKDGQHLTLINVSTPVQWNVINEKGTLSAIKGDVVIQSLEEPVSSFEFPLIGSLHADLAKDEINSEISAVLNGAPLNFSLKATELSDPKVRFALQADMLDFDKLFPATEAVAKPAGQAEPATEPAQEPTQEQPVQASIPTDAVAAKTTPEKPIDLSVLNRIDVAGTVNLGGLNVRGVEAQNVKLNIAAGEGKLNVSNISADLYEGTLTGSLSADAQNRFSAKLGAKQVSTGPLLQALGGTDHLSGVGNANVDLQTHGATVPALKAGLAGSARLNVSKGAIRGIDLNQTLSRVGGILQNVLDGKSPDLKMGFDLGNRTAFDSLDTALNIKSGVAEVQKLDFRTPLLRVTQGKPALIDLVEERLDLLANVRVVKVGGGENEVDLSVLRGMSVPLHVGGTFGAPQFGIVWNQMGGSTVRNAIQRGLLDLIEQQVPRQPEAAAEPAAPAPSPEEAVKNLGKTLKGLLGG